MSEIYTAPKGDQKKYPEIFRGVIKPPQVQEILSTLLESGTVRERHQHRLPHFNTFLIDQLQPHLEM